MTFRTGQAVAAGGVPHKIGWKVCLKLGVAVRNFRVDRHLLWLGIRVRIDKLKDLNPLGAKAK